MFAGQVSVKTQGLFNQPCLPQLQFNYCTVEVYGKLLEAMPNVCNCKLQFTGTVPVPMHRMLLKDTSLIT